MRHISASSARRAGKSPKGLVFGVEMVDSCGFGVICAPFCPSRYNLGIDRKYSSACHHQVGHAKEHEQLRLVLGQSAVTGLAMLEQVLDDVERMLDLRSQTRLGLFELLAEPAQLVRHECLALAAFHGDEPV